MSLILDALSCHRSGRLILSGISATVPPGSALILRGPNGVGKTTLLRCLAGFLPITGGSATLDGRNITDQSEAIALSGHLDAVKPQLTVDETLRFWAAMHGAAMGDVAEAFNLADLTDRPAGQLSAGQKRRLGLARLALTGARLWLMDEPTVSLDADSTGLVAAAVSRHLAGGGIAVISTHQNLSLARAETLTLSAPKAEAPHDPFLAGAFA